MFERQRDGKRKRYLKGRKLITKKSDRLQREKGRKMSQTKKDNETENERVGWS